MSFPELLLWAGGPASFILGLPYILGVLPEKDTNSLLFALGLLAIGLIWKFLEARPTPRRDYPPDNF